jgi:hypothetical protein
VHRKAARRKDVSLAPPVHWLQDSITMSAAFVPNGRLDVVATNALARALHAPMFTSLTTAAHRRANFARYHFLDPASQDFFVDWESGAAALLRAEAGREPYDQALRELVGELSTLSAEFRTLWASHDIRTWHHGIKRLRHPEAGALELTYQSLDLPTAQRSVHDLSLYTAEPGTRHEERLRLLASRSAPGPRTTTPASTTPASTTPAASPRQPERTWKSAQPSSSLTCLQLRLVQFRMP